MYYYLFAFGISEHSLYLLIIICRAGDGVWEEGKVEGWNMNLSSFKSDIGHFWYLMVQNTHGPITF